MTNAHVVEDYLSFKAQGATVAVWVIPANGEKPLDATVKVFDRESNDLAVVDIGEATIPRATLYGGAVKGDVEAAALGYPGNVDRARGVSANGTVSPSAPEVRRAQITSVRESGAPWNGDKGVLVHDLATAPGDSGGPISDLCGRVLGVNESGTKTGESGANFGFAITGADLRAFLSENDIPYASTTQPCLTDRQAAERQVDTMFAATSAAMAKLQEAEAADKAAESIKRGKTILCGLALLLMATLATWRWRKHDRRGTAVFGTFATVALVSFVIVQRSPTYAPAPNVLADTGDATCTLDDQASRIVFDTDDNSRKTQISLLAGQCYGSNRRLFARNGELLTNVNIDPADESVSVSTIDKASGRFEYRNYLLERELFTAAKAALDKTPGQVCDANGKGGDMTLAARRVSDVRTLLPKTPTETIIWNCKPVSKEDGTRTGA
ncbi:hypothetical protein SCLO_1022990 [Sphingobium cloacae]|uniref:Uncharacterized protein n=1 Tax=Sphingobium cloacae TaxID=120107 RepID=A0A1E1F4A4_9SPHN|nr:hypothetical protein SCLO_1022990 [Sphingobium cloacae]